MSIIVSNIRLPLEENDASAIWEAYKKCGLPVQAGRASVYRQSIDARRGKISRVYSVLIETALDDRKFVDKINLPEVRIKAEAHEPIITGDKTIKSRPVVIGMGPAGLFAAYILAKNGYRPIVFERGSDIDKRDSTVDAFFKTGKLNEDSNIQFGEGGAGSYSDGKLTTRINDPLCEAVLKILHENGAPEEILRQAKPHIGTDILKNVVKSIRKAIIRLGGEIHFDAKLTGLVSQNGAVASALIEGESVSCSHLILAIGHSARDTFFALKVCGVLIEPKAFSVGARIEHLQEDIDRAMYGKMAGHPLLPPAEYTLSHRSGERACYSFCMCPGGLVVAGQNEEQSVVTNGMSYHARDGKNANSAIVVSVHPSDFDSSDPLGGIAFQRKIEHAAFLAGGNTNQAPCQKADDFLSGKTTKKIGKVKPTYPLGVALGDISECLPKFVTDMMAEGLTAFGRKIHGFDAQDAILTAPETRTSSPVRLTRGQDLMSADIKGLIPCGEGAGYAGGIMSAAVDGMRAAGRIMSEFKPE